MTPAIMPVAAVPVSLNDWPPADISTAIVVPFFKTHAVSVVVVPPKVELTVTLSVVALL